MDVFLENSAGAFLDGVGLEGVLATPEIEIGLATLTVTPVSSSVIDYLPIEK